MCVCVCVCVCVYIYVCVYIHMYLKVYISSKSALYGYAPIFHFSERFSWLTCVDFFFTSGTSVRCVVNSFFFILLYSWIFL